MRKWDAQLRVLECDDLSSLSEGDLLPSKTFVVVVNCWTRLCFADKSAKRKSCDESQALQRFYKSVTTLLCERRTIVT